MPPAARRPQPSRAERREQLQQELLGEVRRLIGEGLSYPEMSVDRLSAAVGVSPSTFYVYFEDKGDLLRAWFAGVEDEIARGAKAWISLGPEVSFAGVREALRDLARVYEPHVALMGAMFDAASYDSGVRDVTGAMMATYRAGLRRHIVAGQQQGFVDPTLLADETAGWLTWMAERGFHQVVGASEAHEVGELVDGFAQVVWYTLYAPAARG